MLVDGQRRWVEYTDLALDAEDFTSIGDAFGATGLERAAAVGAGQGRWARRRDIEHFGVAWIEANR